MADIRPFAAIRPKKGLEHRIAALPYDVYSSEEARRETKEEPMSFLKIDRAETQFTEDVDMYSELVYQKAHNMLWDMVAKGEFVQEDISCYYIYELEMNGRIQTGIAACASVDDYIENIIKKHENTRAEKEKDRICHVSVCEAQTGPIFLAYRSKTEINEQVEKIKKESPLYDFTADDMVTHRLWSIRDVETIRIIRKAFSEMQDIYIADGHHRCASAVKVGLLKREEKPDYTGEEEFNYFLSVLFPDDQLMIMDYNRAVKDLNGYTEAEFLHKLSEKFKVKCLGTEARHPENKGIVSMYLDEKWYTVSMESMQNDSIDDPVAGLDVSVLQNEILEPLLGILDAKRDNRIEFIGGIRGLEELERRVKLDCKVAFAMYPTSIEELFRVADAGLLMPPKSTWFEPKLRSGLLIHSMK